MFERYFQKIEERLNPRTLPFRSKLVARNKVRVAAKHHGVKPDSSEAEGFALICREFFDESCSLVFGVQFLSVSLIDLLDGGEIKDLLVVAKSAFDERLWYKSMIVCRKVLFLEFENQFNVEKFKNGKENVDFFYKITSAPYYATENEYIDQRVGTPFDYIVVDHQQLSNQLMENGIDTHVFWNICRTDHRSTDIVTIMSLLLVGL